MLEHQHIVHCLNGTTPSTGSMAVPRHASRVPELLFILGIVIWSAHCYSTVPHPGYAQTTPVPMGAPGSTAQDWMEGTTSDASPGLYIDMGKLYGHLRGYRHLKGFAK